MARPRGTQKGYVYTKGPSWFGRWYSYNRGHLKPQCMRLGAADELDKEAAQAKLAAIIQREVDRQPLWKRIGARDVVLLKPDDARLTDRPAHLGRGTVSELLVCVDLIRKGIHPFRAVDPQAICDLVIWDGDRFQRVEVKSARPNPRGVIISDVTRNFGRFDIAAFVFADGFIAYKAAEELTDPKYPFGRKPYLRNESDSQLLNKKQTASSQDAEEKTA